MAERLCGKCGKVVQMIEDEAIVDGFGDKQWLVEQSTCPICGHKTTHRTRTDKIRR